MRIEFRTFESTASPKPPTIRLHLDGFSKILYTNKLKANPNSN